MKKLIIICTVLIACIFSACNQQQNISSTHQRVNNKGVNIDYTDTHLGDTTLLFIHGWCLNKTYWQDQVAYFKPHYRIVAIDLPGFGKSGRNRTAYNTRIFAGDVAAVIGQLHLNKVILIGHSMAGDIIVKAARLQPNQIIDLVGVDNFKSVAVGDGKAPTRQDSLAYDAAIDSMRHNFKMVATDYFEKDLFYKTTPKAVRNRILNDVAHADPPIASACMEMDNFDEAEELRKAGKKLYLINSDYQPTHTTDLKIKGIPYQLSYIHATGHFPMVEKPAEFNRLLALAIKSM